MSTLGTRFLSAVGGATAQKWFQYGGRLPPLFEDDPTAQAAFNFVDAFARKHGKVPTATTIQEATGLMLAPESTDAEFLFDQLVDRRIKRHLALTGQDIQKLLAMKPREALAIMHKASFTLTTELATPEVYDFKQSVHTLWPWLVSKWTGEFTSVPFPWTTLQTMSGGTYGGEIVSIVGRTGLGKTWLMLDLALYAWAVLKQPVVFVSLEMMARAILERLAAMYTHTPMDQLKHAHAPNFYTAKKEYKVAMYEQLVALEASDMPPFIVVDGNLAASVSDVLAVCHRYNPIACVVDGAYMLKHPNPRLAKHERITENIEALKRDVATGLDTALFASWQFNRDATRLKAGDMPGPEHVGGGDGIGNTSSVLLGLFQGDDAGGDASKITKRTVNVLKGRGGERGKFEIMWDFARMDFREKDPNAKAVLSGIVLEDLDVPEPAYEVS